MLVSISGAPLAGKTTLHAQMSEYFAATREAFRFVADIPRQAISRIGVELAERDRAAFQHYVGIAQLVAEGESQSPGTSIFDKSLLDAVAYWDVFLGGRRPDWCNKLARDRYELILVCDHTEILPHGDTIDLMHADARDDLGRRILTVATDLGLPIVRVSGKQRERLSTAIRAVESLALHA
jgi:predicted ATPase